MSPILSGVAFLRHFDSTRRARVFSFHDLQALHLSAYAAAPVPGGNRYRRKEMNCKIILMVSVLFFGLACPSLAEQCRRGEGYAGNHVDPTCYWEGASSKLVRGATNVLTFPVEIPKQMFLATREKGAVGPITGIFRGIGMGASRLVYGLGEAATFLLPNDLEDWDFQPVMKPAYVWNGEE
jgi:putative exosortase-associated protein (TIGR04073 family)